MRRRRARMLRELAELFRSAAGRLQPAQLRIFDDVLSRLIERSDARALASISASLAGLEPAPAGDQEAAEALAQFEWESEGVYLAFDKPKEKQQGLADTTLRFFDHDCDEENALSPEGRKLLEDFHDPTLPTVERMCLAAAMQARKRSIPQRGARTTELPDRATTPPARRGTSVRAPARRADGGCPAAAHRVLPTRQ